MMQVIAQQTDMTEAHSTTKPFAIRFEVMAILALVIFSATFHFAGLDEIPLSHSEAQAALSAWRAVMPNVTGDAIVADSPLVLWSQKIAFTLLGGTEFSSRLFTALASTLLSLSPFLFMSLLGKSRTFIMVILFTASPLLLTTGRMSSGTTWAMLMGVLAVWLVWRYWETGQKRYGTSAIVAGAFLVLMTESQGAVLALILLCAGIVAYLLTIYSAFIDESPAELIQNTRARVMQLPLLSGLGISALLIFAVGSGFMFAPEGLTAISELLSRFWGGWSTVQRHPLAYNPLDALLFYEIWLIPFFFIAVSLLISQQKMTFVERFLIAWVVLAFVALLIYPDTTTAHALWFVIPMVGLMAYVIYQAFLHIHPNDIYPVLVTDERGLLWGKFVVALAMFTLMILLVSHLQFMSRGILLLQNGTPSTFFASLGSVELAQQIQRNRFVGVSEAMIVGVIVLVMMLIGYFLATTIWGTVAPLQGAVIGMFAFVWMAGLGTAWAVAYHRADKPVELFHYPQTTSKHTILLRQTMNEIAFRKTQGVPSLPIAVLAPSDGVVAWVLRDFHRAHYVASIQEAQAYEVIVMPIGGNIRQSNMNLGGDYVGQQFAISTQWSGVSGVASYWQPLRHNMDILRHPHRAFIWEMNLEVMTWWLLREVRQSPQSGELVIVWVRQDVYDNVPLTLPTSQ